MRLLLPALFLSSVLVVPFSGHALTLEEGLKVVAASGRDVKIAESDQEAARGSVSLARSAWLPQVNVYANETWLRYQPASKLPFDFPGAPSSIPVSQDQYLSYGVTANQLLYDFGKTSSNVDSAKYALKAREVQTQRARNRSALDFIMAYYDLLEADKLLQVAGEEVKQFEAHKHDAEVRFNAGVVTRNEVLQANVRLADSQQRYLTAENNRSLRASRINSLLLRPLNEPVQPEEVTKKLSAGITLESAWSIAESESPEIQVIDATIKAKEASIRATQADYMPNIFLSGGYQYQENQYVVYPHNWSLIAGATFNLFSGGATSSRVHIGKSELASLKTTRDKITDAVRLDVKGAYLDLQSSGKKMEVMRTSVEQAEENLRLQRLRYQEGVGTALEVLDAVTLLTASQIDSWRAVYGFERADAGLQYAMGRNLTAMYGNTSTKSEAPNIK